MGLDMTIHLDRCGNPVQDPFGSYITANMDSAGVIQYVLAIDPLGAWKILKIDTANETYRMARGQKDYVAAWNNRVSLGYDYPDKVW
jgi:hypothetical protein